MTPAITGHVKRTWANQDGVRFAIVRPVGRGDQIQAVIPRGVQVEEGSNVAVEARDGQFIVKR